MLSLPKQTTRRTRKKLPQTRTEFAVIAHRYILDTNIFLNDPKSMYAFPGDIVKIPLEVIEEIDDQKRRVDDVGRNARQTSRILASRKRIPKTNVSSSQKTSTCASRPTPSALKP